MFKHLLVPLDGSRMAEVSLATAVSLARAMGAVVTLFHVIESGAPQDIHGERHLTGPDEARDYLDEVAARALPADISVERHVHTNEVNDVARSIAEHVGELGPDLIVMCTHGRGGLRGFMFGRIAQQVVGLGTTPVLLVPPAATGDSPSFSCRRILVALDGNPDHEEGVKVAAGLAKIYGAELGLVMAVHTTDTLSGEEATPAKLLPGATRALLDLAAEDAEKYLGHHVTALRAAGFTVTSEVRRGDPPTVIIAAAERMKADLIVLGTHGKTGMDAFWSGSATPNVTSRSVVPLLLVPVRSKEPEE
ncbi:universal stress protein [Candidatus Deferrimicrobium sp.]|uniref:universal stress protein n=1 Tax=Candidatus Deferrimicrobium sp. TaxID=3060586 RepID=UPI002ED41C57